MAFIAPMLASPLKPGITFAPGEWVAEQKYDGIRLIVEVNRDIPEDLLSDSTIVSWSRNAIIHAMPRHLRAEFAKLPTGIYDVEMFVPGKRSFGATRLDHSDQMQAVIFDLLELMGEDTRRLTLEARRALLVEMFNPRNAHAVRSASLTLSESRIINTFDDVITFRDEVWQRDGEGLILKQKSAVYRPGKRDKSWIKIKKLQSAVLTVIGFARSLGEIENRGDFAMVILRDDDGIVTSVKTRNREELARLEKTAPAISDRNWVQMRIGPRPFQVCINHPFVGRKLRIEYQERTAPDNSYRHPRFDHWCEDEK